MKHAFKVAGLGLLAGAAVTLAVLPASARGPLGGDIGPRGGLFQAEFADMDVDGNGQITEEDLLGLAEQRLAEVDADGNGVLNAAELAARIGERATLRMGPRGGDPSAWAEAVAGRMIDRRDADDDGALSVAELGPDKGFGRIIDRFDTDDDNAISEAEFDEAKAQMKDRRGKRHGSRDDQRGGPRGGHSGWFGQNR